MTRFAVYLRRADKSRVRILCETVDGLPGLMSHHVAIAPADGGWISVDPALYPVADIIICALALCQTPTLIAIDDQPAMPCFVVHDGANMALAIEGMYQRLGASALLEAS